MNMRFLPLKDHALNTGLITVFLLRLVDFQDRSRQLMQFLVLATLKIGRLAALTITGSQKITFKFFHKLKAFHLLTTEDSSVGKV